jgi:hypothetical protein
MIFVGVSRLYIRASPRRAGGNYDWADDTENGRIRLCIDAGSWRSMNEMATAARDAGVSRAAVPKKSRLVARGANPIEQYPATPVSSAPS